MAREVKLNVEFQKLLKVASTILSRSINKSFC